MADKPHIEYLDPDTVEQGSERSLRVLGKNFGDYNIVIVDSIHIETKTVSNHEVVGELTKKQTASPGEKLVWMYNGEGELSNRKPLTVVEREK